MAPRLQLGPEVKELGSIAQAEPEKSERKLSTSSGYSVAGITGGPEMISLPIPQTGSSGSSSPTLSDSPNLSELLRSTSAMARSDGPSSGSSPAQLTQPTQPTSSPQRRETELAESLVNAPGTTIRRQNAFDEAQEDEPICVFSTNVSDEGFSGDDLDLP